MKKYISFFIKSYKLYFICLLMLATSAGIFEISVDYKIKELIDAITLSKVSNLSYLLFMFVIYKLIYHGVFFVQRLLDLKYQPIILENVVKDIYFKTIKHSLNWFDSHLSGEISSKIADFQDAMLSLISCCARMFRTIITTIITLFFILHVNLLTALILGIFIVIYNPIIFFLLKNQMELQKKYVNAKQEALGIVNDSISNIFGIKIIGDARSEFKSKLHPAILNWKNWDYKTRKFDAYFVDAIDTVMVVTLNTVQIYTLAHLYQNNVISAGDFAFIAMITLKIHKQLEELLENILFNITPKIAQIKASYAFIDKGLDVIDAKNAKVLKKVNGHIEFKNVTYSYGQHNKHVLNNFNLNIKAGERLGIVGTSGAGKTTIIKCLLRYFDVINGSILVDGNDINTVTQDSLRKFISVIPQDITMFHRSILENLRLARSKATSQEIESACIKAKIHHDIMLLPEGYNTIVGERGVKLSGGQRQRIAIARAILKNAPILILDEATSSLDTYTENLIQESINNLLKTSPATVIAIAHRLSTLKNTDRIIVLDQGKIIQNGSHKELLTKGGLYKKLWDAQNDGFIF